MPSFTKLAITSLALLAHSTSAAPILNGVLGGTETGSITANLKAKVDALVNTGNGDCHNCGGSGGKLTDGLLVTGSGKSDLKLFADAFLTVTTGGHSTSCDNVDSGQAAHLAANVKAQVFGRLAVTQCVATYSDATACAEFGAYLAATYYAYISGWAGATFFAALEQTRVDRWQALLYGFCDSDCAPSGICNDWYTQWNTFHHAAETCKSDVQAAAKANLKLSGFLSTCDSTALLKVDADGKIHVGGVATINANAAVHATATDIHHRGLDLFNNHHEHEGVGALANVVAHVVADAKIKSVGTGNLHHRDLLDSLHIMGNAKGQGEGHGVLALTGDKGVLALGGQGKGKGFLGAVVA